MEFSVKRRLVIFLLLVSLLAPTAVFAEVSTQQVTDDNAAGAMAHEYEVALLERGGSA